MDAPARQTPIPAATLILFRDRANGPPELLFVERSAAMRFAAGAIVFPGGRIDAADYALAAVLAGSTGDDDDRDAAARIAAIRETIEEVGLAIGVMPPEQGEMLRERLVAGTAMGEALAGAGASLSLDDLVPFARWCPEFEHARVFDTRFYIAHLPVGSPEPQVDGTENVRLFWSTARALIDAVEAGRERAIFPTLRTLDRLATYRSFADAVADARRYPVRKITPWIEQRQGERMLCIPDDLGFPVTAERLDEAFRT